VRKIATVVPLLVVLFAATLVPAAQADNRVEPPAECAGLVSKLANTLKKVVGSLTAVPPDPAKSAPQLGDVLGVLTELQSAKCLPAPPVSVPAAPVPTRALGPEQCLPLAMQLNAAVFGLLAKVVPGAAPPDATKLLPELTALLKTVSDALSACGLPAPPGGLPTVPTLPVQ
jgi:hypothetical protein